MVPSGWRLWSVFSPIQGTSLAQYFVWQISHEEENLSCPVKCYCTVSLRWWWFKRQNWTQMGIGVPSAGENSLAVLKLVTSWKWWSHPPDSVSAALPAERPRTSAPAGPSSCPLHCDTSLFWFVLREITINPNLGICSQPLLVKLDHLVNSGGHQTFPPLDNYWLFAVTIIHVLWESLTSATCKSAP